ncbi:MAG: hypothetical protein LBR75_05955, partial [Prevotellaceae bacterium]|nr:hypothetical protein [Prevotellaceae bacterium]
MRKENLRILFVGLAMMLFPVFSYAANEGEKTVTVNMGEMYIGGNDGDAAMLVTRSLAVHDGSDINVAEGNSELHIGGSVYQSASKASNGSTSKGFSVDNEGRPSGSGTVVFVDVDGVSNADNSLQDWHNEPDNRVGTEIEDHICDKYNSDGGEDGKGSRISARFITALDS